jgi:hypothetical protein
MRIVPKHHNKRRRPSLPNLTGHHTRSQGGLLLADASCQENQGFSQPAVLMQRYGGFGQTFDGGRASVQIHQGLQGIHGMCS